MVNHIIPRSLQEALNYLATNQYQVIAGGTDLMIHNRSWAETPTNFHKSMLYISQLEELNYIKWDDENLYIGATTPLEVILRHSKTPTLLKEVIGEMASPAIRNVGTLAGNIANASPAGDSLIVLYLLGASIVLTSKLCDEVILVKDFITGPKQTKLEPSFMIKEIIVPRVTFTKSKFVKVGGRLADAISKVSFVAGAIIKDSSIVDIRIAFGAVAKTVVRQKDLESILIGKKVEVVSQMIPLLVEQYSEFINPIDDQRSNKRYRKTVALQLLIEFLQSLTNL